MNLRRAGGPLLLGIAWLLYLASLVLPACEPTRGDAPKPTGICSPGWEVVLFLMFPLFWVFVFPLVYLLVNVTFWLSPLCALFAGVRPTARWIYTVILGAAALLAWASAGIVETVGVGYVVWSSSLTVATLAFALWAGSVPPPEIGVSRGDVPRPA